MEGIYSPFQILLIYAIRYSVGAPIGAVYKAIGRPDINLKIGLSMMPFYILAIIFGSSYGIIGVAIGVTFIRTFFGLVSFIILANILQTYVSTFLKQMKNSFFAAMITALIIKITKQLFINMFDFNQISSFIILFSLGIILYLFLIKVFFNESYNEIQKIFKKILIKKNRIIK